jgi:hypothetical protein
VPSWAVEGMIVKRELVEYKRLNQSTSKLEKTIKTRIRAVDRGVKEFSEEGLRLVIEKY